MNPTTIVDGKIQPGERTYSCANCVYWDGTKNGDIQLQLDCGWCRRHAPGLVVTEGDDGFKHAIAMFPSTHKNYYCGYHAGFEVNPVTTNKPEPSPAATVRPYYFYEHCLKLQPCGHWGLPSMYPDKNGKGCCTACSNMERFGHP